MKRRFLSAVLSAVRLLTIPSITGIASGAPQEGREIQKRVYHFRQEDAPKLRENYKNMSRVDTGHRQENHARYVAGGHLPDDWRKHIQPVRASLVRELPAIPRGCAIGYIDGYCVVYDPATEIVDVLDLSS